MAQKALPALEHDSVRPAGFKRQNALVEPLLGIERLRISAAFSHEPKERSAALSMLCDLDSLSFVAEQSPHEDSRAQAVAGIRYRLLSFSADALTHLSENCGSPTARFCAREMLR